MKRKFKRPYKSSANQLEQKIAPFVLLIHAFTCVFLLTWLIFILQGHSPSKMVSLNYSQNKMIHFEASEANSLYEFDLSQIMTGENLPEYSELEIEILSSDLDHIYTFYKDLWREVHPDGDGGSAIYSDNEIKFSIVLDKAGSYYLRPNSFNGNCGDIIGSITKKNIGNIYTNRFLCVFGIASFLLFVFREYVGEPLSDFKQILRFGRFRKNKIWLLLFGVFMSLWIMVIYVNLTFMGFAKGGDQTILPNRFFPTEKTTYLG